MNRNLISASIASLLLLTILIFYSPARAQRPQDGYWEFQNAEDFATDERGNEVMRKSPYDVKKHEGYSTETRGGPDQPGYGRERHIFISSLKVPETINGDEFQAVVTGNGWAELIEKREWHNFFMLKLVHHGTSASGEDLTCLCVHPDHVVKVGQQEKFEFGTVMLSVPKSAEDFTIRLIFIINEPFGGGDVRTWTILLHYKWRTGRPASDSKTGAASVNEPSSANDPLEVLRRRSGSNANESSTANDPLEVLRELQRRLDAVKVEDNVNLKGGDYKNFDAKDLDPEQCQYACANDPKCKAFTYVKPGAFKKGASAWCWLKSSVPPRATDSCCVSGMKSTSAGP